MKQFLSPALRQPPLPDSEKKRLRELSRYYCTIRPPSPVAGDEKLNGPRLSSDITLTALTQLGVHRFGCMRSYVSLIDGQNQHIISEATASISLRDSDNHRPNDGLYLGATTLDLVFGVCPHAVKLFSGFDVPHLKNTANVTANQTRYLVRDFTLEEYFKDRPYVTEWPYFRFYAEVPIYSPSGHILGSYCVVDNKPRRDFSEEDVIALQEVSDAIALHLENVRTVHYHRRSDRLVRGLTTFVKDHPHDRNAPLTAANLHDIAAPQRQSERSQPEGLALHELSLGTDPTGDSSPLYSHREGADVSTEATSLSVASPDPADSPPLETSTPRAETVQGHMQEISSGKVSPVHAAKESVPLSNRIGNVFACARSLIRESMDVDGVLFVDASSCNSGIVRPKTDLLAWEPLPKNADPRPRNLPPYSFPAVPAGETVCDTLGLESEHKPRHVVPDSLLRQLIAALPQGGVLHPDMDCDDPRLLETRVAKCFPQAKSLLFIPLWDWNKGQWRAGTFVWTKDSDHELALGLDELHYFKVFGDSIISEIARMDWSQKEKSKFDLISSVSHELRSPLHGMLANAELLSASPLSPDQAETVKALETCGITLLDTMNSLLDFAKINNITSNNQGGASSITILVSTFDLDVLIEEVVNSVFSGMHHAAVASKPTATHASTFERDMRSHDRSVVLRFESQEQWKVTSMTGAWRRIVMNILGNALKYTDRGFVELSASLLRPSLDSDSVIAHLRFADSGRGMSEEFLRNKLFSPFAQEDTLSEGAGLGLSIARQLVSFLKGSIDVKSELGVGTQVDIFIPVKTVPPSSDVSVEKTPEAAAGIPAQHATFSLVGLGAYPGLSEEPTGTLSTGAKRKICLQSFFAQLIAEQPGWSVLSTESLDNADGDIVIIDESILNQAYGNESQRRLVERKRAQFVCLCNGMRSLSTDEPADGGQVVRLYQPFAPRKVLQVLKSALQAKPPSGVPARDEVPATRKVSITTSPQEPLASSCGPPVPSGSGKVLLVDDNDLNIKVLAKLMSKLGYQYTTATNGLVALNTYKESPATFKMILMDLSMPVMDGIDATRHIRNFEQDRSLTPVKIFAVTGVASDAMEKEASMAGVDDYLVKPLSLHRLGKLMKAHL
ncbi:hypothetical protein BJX76DRAFT_364708 [Aspergillus varians]